jgi:hypothetical protein
MLARFSEFLKRHATGRNVIVFFLLSAIFMFGVMPAAGARIGAAPLDLRLTYTAAEAFEAVAAYGEAGRAAYLLTQLTLDIAYPVVYTLFFGLLIAWLFRKGLPAESRLHRLNAVPLGAFAFDILENLSVAALLGAYPARPAVVGALAGAFTLLKWLFAGAGAVVVLIGLVARIRKGRG